MDHLIKLVSNNDRETGENLSMPEYHSPKKEHPSTYLIKNREDPSELQRLMIQDRMMTTLQDGFLPEQTDLTNIHHILDVACGPGLWLLDATPTYPDMLFTGIDISQQMVTYARTLAEQQQLSQRVEFYVMDALRMLEFLDQTFDLVNLRIGSSFLRTWEWPKLLSEMVRVLRTGGIIRLTESEISTEVNSTALGELTRLFRTTLYRAGHLFEDEPTGITAHLPDLLSRHGVQNIQIRRVTKHLQAGTSECTASCQDTERAFRLLRPFIEKWDRASLARYDNIYEQALIEMQQPDFYANWNLVTIWGTKAVLKA